MTAITPAYTWRITEPETWDWTPEPDDDENDADDEGDGGDQ
jgi:hypothetical protein